ncbi:DUF4202 domain-containing protein [Psychromonas sp. 14N.309.X.WAT.B.A12]|uniref:DUF4202 domain-containing protein n=1 Tax=Psychromonas sp. 14N.309.X.WAT.B.A12 TaxID=2998322 RepID=UPI0025AF12A4|nr:DUF4202 domain-containing protein [Psychromonas sp. 14N.309.X.WAT.B.A12]MDN2663816.1 DUF4202 domain-containing protein [Psychromonas sp. 14N.309.X.WAT.B.A12]
MSTQQLEQLIALIDDANNQDPNIVSLAGVEWPKERLYSQRMTEMLFRFKHDASEIIQIAVRGQHIQRWQSLRSDYPEGKQGYHQWRTNLYTFHANRVAELMQQAGYQADTIEQVKNAVGKKSIKRNPDSQLLEDIAGLVFVEYYMLEFANKHPEYSEEKWMGIILKTWKKMSDDAHQFALAGGITLPVPLQSLIVKAIS